MDASASLTVMVVDDDVDLRSAVVAVLKGAGCTVCEAANGRVALDMLLDGARPDVILLDLMMPDMDGWTFRAEQKKHPSIATIPVIVFSAIGVDDEGALGLDAQGYLKKPLGFDELVRTMTRFAPRGNGAHV